MKRVLLIGLFVGLLAFTRLFNIDSTTRFIWDESSDLTRVHQIYVDRKLTLVGPISEDNAKVFSSLAYYLSMPFAILGNFDPLSPVLGTVLGAFVTAIALILLTRKVNPTRSIVLVALIILTWFPLLQSGRAGLWAWHVSYLPMWTVLGLLCYLAPGNISKILAGLFLGLTVHHHYLSLFAVVSFATGVTIYNLRKKVVVPTLFLLSGMAMAILPFVVFDLRHPPGLFLTKMLYGSPITTQTTIETGFAKLAQLFNEMSSFFTQSEFWAPIFGIEILSLFFWDIKNRSRTLLWSAPWVGQLIGLVFINNDGVSIHYHLPAAPFFLIWLLATRNNLGKHIATTLLTILALTAVNSLIPQLSAKTWRTDIRSVRLLTRAMQTEIETNHLQNNNLAVLASPDNNVYGRRYRDVLLVNEVRLRTRDEYQYTDHLFVISTSDEQTIRNDKAYEMHFFRNGKLLREWGWPESEWRLYLFNRDSR